MIYEEKFLEIATALGAKVFSAKYGQIEYKGLYISMYFVESNEVWPIYNKKAGRQIHWIIDESPKVHRAGFYIPTKKIVRRIKIGCTLLSKKSCAP